MGPINTLCFGDSLTEGWNFQVGGYRLPLMGMMAAAGVQLAYVGDQATGNPAGRTDLNHHGIYTMPGGYNTSLAIADVQGGLIQATLPDVVLLCIGTNDVHIGNVPAFQSAYAALCNLIFAARPVRLVTMGIPVSPNNAALVGPYNAALIAAVETISGHALNYIPAPAIPANWFWDGTHPTVEGYNLIALAWASWLAQVLQA